MPGPPPSQDRARAATPTKAVLTVQVLPALVDADAPPAPPDGLAGELLDDWHDFWRSPLAKGISTTALPAFRRLFRYRAMQAELFADAERWGFLAEGSEDQLVAHPALKAAMALESKILALEDRFALTLKAEQNTGIRMGQLADAAVKVAEAQAALTQETTPRADPRLANTGAAPT